MKLEIESHDWTLPSNLHSFCTDLEVTYFHILHICCNLKRLYIATECCTSSTYCILHMFIRFLVYLYIYIVNNIWIHITYISYIWCIILELGMNDLPQYALEAEESHRGRTGWVGPFSYINMQNIIFRFHGNMMGQECPLLCITISLYFFSIYLIASNSHLTRSFTLTIPFSYTAWPWTSYGTGSLLLLANLSSLVSEPPVPCCVRYLDPSILACTSSWRCANNGKAF